MRGVLSDIAHATAFLTRLPVPDAWFDGRKLDFSRCAWAFPIVGLVSAGPAVIVLTLASPGCFEWSIFPVVLAYCALLLTTGALHEDGMADVADGFWGGGNAERRLEIMKDSRIGTYGVLALIAVMALRITLMMEVVVVTNRDHSVGDMSIEEALRSGGILAAAVVAGKVALLLHWRLSTPAPVRGSSLAARYGRPGWNQVVTGAVLACILIGLLALPAGSHGFLGGVAAMLLSVLVILRVSNAKIGGHNGDTLGAAAVLGECAFLVGLVLTISRP